MQTSGLLEELRLIRARAEALVARVPDDAAFTWQPNEGRSWSVGQCLEHLNEMHRVYFGTIREALARAPRSTTVVTAPLRSTWFGRRFAKSMEPGTLKMRAPSAVVPQTVRARDEVVADFFRGLDEVERTLEDAATIDLNTPTYPSPFFRFSRVRAGTGFRILLAHLRRHLAQAEAVIAKVSTGKRG